MQKTSKYFRIFFSMVERRAKGIPEDELVSEESQISEEEVLNLIFKSILDQYFPDGYDPDLMTDKIKGEMMADMLSLALELPKNAKFIDAFKKN